MMYARMPRLTRWHHYAGLIFWLATFTWILSRCLSLDPWSWHPGTSPTQQQLEAVAGGPLQLNPLTMARMREGIAAIASSFAPKERDVVQFQGEPFLVAYRAPSADHSDQWPDDPSKFLSPVLPLVHRVISAVAPEHGAFTRFDDGAVRAAARAAMPGAAVEDEAWLEEYDAYYYDRYGARPLPVLRVRYDDPSRTWLYLDPQRGAIVRKEERLSRVNRSLYHGLHSFDFPFLYYRRPLWDVVVIVLSLGGTVLSASTLVAAWLACGDTGAVWRGRTARAAHQILTPATVAHSAPPRPAAGTIRFTRDPRSWYAVPRRTISHS